MKIAYSAIHTTSDIISVSSSFIFSFNNKEYNKLYLMLVKQQLIGLELSIYLN